MSINLNDRYFKNFVKENELCEIFPLLEAAHKSLENKTGAGNDFLGWVNLPCEIKGEETSKVLEAAEKIRQNSDVLVVIGIGGSYLGARAVIEAVKSQFHNFLDYERTPQVFFAGNNMNPTYLNKIVELCEDKDFSVNVISKSGTTTEPAIAFRIFKKLLEKKYGKDGAKERIYCTTDSSKGKLKELADLNGYSQFVIPDDVGGRFSVLTPVGLLPLAVAGVNIEKLVEGAANAVSDFKECNLESNSCYQYATVRNILYKKGRRVEILVSYEPFLQSFQEWFKQLYGESEGKDGKGIFPASAIFSAELHSIGQYIQDGPKFIFETVLDFKKPVKDFYVEKEDDNFDGLNFLADKNLSEINRKAFEGTLLAHSNGCVPNVVLEIDELNEYSLGYLIYFFEKACAISGYMLGVNPFNQPGVEKYKTNMFALLKKPGYENIKL